MHVFILTNHMLILITQAPEIYMGDHRHGAAADWYVLPYHTTYHVCCRGNTYIRICVYRFAVGVTLHEALCGKRPFEPHRLQAFKDHPRHTDSLSLSYNMQQGGYVHLSAPGKQFLSSLLNGRAICRYVSYPCM